MTVDLDFPSVVRAHQAQYPLMRPQDYGKLAYQIEFGPRHMALEWEAVLSGLQREWEEAPPLLARLFLRTARKRRGSLDGLGQKLELLGRLDIPGMDGWLAEYRRQGCPVPSHSEAFHAAYRPRYRLLEAWYAHSFSALLEIDRPVRKRQDPLCRPHSGAVPLQRHPYGRLLPPDGKTASRLGGQGRRPYGFFPLPV